MSNYYSSWLSTLVVCFFSWFRFYRSFHPWKSRYVQNTISKIARNACLSLVHAWQAGEKMARPLSSLETVCSFFLRCCPPPMMMMASMKSSGTESPSHGISIIIIIIPLIRLSRHFLSLLSQRSLIIDYLS